MPSAGGHWVSWGERVAEPTGLLIGAGDGSSGMSSGAWEAGRGSSQAPRS